MISLSTLPVSRLYSVDDRKIDECGAVGGTKVAGGRRKLGGNPLQCHFVHH
jgi:hypothetical protein